MKIFFSGGGTLGSVSPLLAIFEILKKHFPDVEIVWLGTKNGPERELVKSYGIRFITLPAGKFRRYFSLWNITDISRVIAAFFKSLFLIIAYRPACCISAGAFVSVPLHTAAWLLGVPTWIHAQDVRRGLATILMSPFASQITTTLQTQTTLFSSNRTKWLGNPVRETILSGSASRAIDLFKLDPNLPVVLATGGGTGSKRINDLILEALPDLEGLCQVIHLTGSTRPQDSVSSAAKLFSFYHPYSFMGEEMPDAYAVADIVVARAGFGTIAELAALAKPSILIPKEGHQEENVKFLVNENAALFMDERSATGYELAKSIKALLLDEEQKNMLGQKLLEVLPIAKEEDIVAIVKKLISV